MHKVLKYPRTHVRQDTYYNCGPASCQTVILAATGNLIGEVTLGRALGTHTGGTDYIGQFPRVLNANIPGAQYRFRNLPNDPPTAAQKEQLWRDIVGSINAGHGVVANIVAPVSNYPRAVAPSTISPAYRGGTVYHYIALMGYSTEGQRKVWVADSGFAPFGYWLALDQLATLIPPKGYAYSTTPAPTPAPPRHELKPEKETPKVDAKLADIHHELTHRFDSRYDLARLANDEITPAEVYRDTLVGYVLNTDSKVEDMHANMLPAINVALERVEAKLDQLLAVKK